MSPLNSAAFCFICSILMGVESLCVCLCVCARCEMEGEQTSAETDIKCFTVWCSETAHPPVHSPSRDRRYCKNRAAPAPYYFSGLISSWSCLIMLVIRIDGDTYCGWKWWTPWYTTKYQFYSLNHPFYIMIPLTLMLFWNILHWTEQTGWCLYELLASVVMFPSLGGHSFMSCDKLKAWIYLHSIISRFSNTCFLISHVITLWHV